MLNKKLMIALMSIAFTFNMLHADTNCTQNAQEGSISFYHENYLEAQKLLSKAAEAGDPSAQYYLGIMYLNGYGVPQNFKRAAMLLTLAAKQNNQDAQAILGWVYKYGVGVPENKIIAYALWNSVAAKGNEWARINRNYMLQEMTEEELYKVQDISLNLTALWNILENKQILPHKSSKKKKSKKH